MIPDSKTSESLLAGSQPMRGRSTTLLRLALVLIIAAMLGDIVLKCVIPSFSAQKTDFTDVYIGSALWLRGDDPYRVDHATQLSRERTGSDREIRVLYPPSTFVVAAPLAWLPWRWASAIAGLLGLAAVLAVAWSVARLADAPLNSLRGLGLIAFAVAFSPLHVAGEVQNISLQVTGLCLLAMAMAHVGRQRTASVAAALAICLKPQLAIWLLGYFLLASGAGIALWASGLTGLVAVIGLLRLGMGPWTALAAMRANMHAGAMPGMLNDISAANPGRFHMIHLEVLATQLWGAWSGIQIVILAMVGAGVLCWVYAVRRNRALPPALALSALAGLVLLVVYHRVYDAGVLLPAMAWAWSSREPMRRGERIAVTVLMGLLIPLRSLIYRVEPHLPSGIRASWEWQSVVLPHYTWIIGALVILLLVAMLRDSSERNCAGAA